MHPAVLVPMTCSSLQVSLPHAVRGDSVIAPANLTWLGSCLAVVVVVVVVVVVAVAVVALVVVVLCCLVLVVVLVVVALGLAVTLVHGLLAVMGTRRRPPPPHY